jgi:hypothetical protein
MVSETFLKKLSPSFSLFLFHSVIGDRRLPGIAAAAPLSSLNGSDDGSSMTAMAGLTIAGVVLMATMSSILSPSNASSTMSSSSMPDWHRLNSHPIHYITDISCCFPSLFLFRAKKAPSHTPHSTFR